MVAVRKQTHPRSRVPRLLCASSPPHTKLDNGRLDCDVNNSLRQQQTCCDLIVRLQLTQQTSPRVDCYWSKFLQFP
jgi:hypothetical protein